MILRSLRGVHLAALPDVHVRELPRTGVARLALPQGATAEGLAAALHFGLCGADPGDELIADGHGFAFVEVGIETSTGEPVSLFRGVDRRGVAQVSLREDAVQRVTGGAEAVARRLEELSGAPATVWWPAVAVGSARRGDPPGAATPGTSDDVARAATGTRDAVAALRGTLRAERLRRLALARLAELDDLGSRLRSERDATARAHAACATHDAAQPDSAPPPAPPPAAPPAPAEPAADAGPAAPFGAPTATVERLLAGCALVCLAVLTSYGLGARDDPWRRDVTSLLGLLFLFTAACHLAVAARRRALVEASAQHVAPRPTRADAGGAARAPQPPPPKARAEAPREDTRVPALRAQLEALDQALAAHAIERIRAARLLDASPLEPAPPADAAAPRLPADLTPAGAAARSRVLGDEICALCAERTALLAESSEDVTAVRDRVLAAFARLAVAAGRPGAEQDVRARLDAFRSVRAEDATEDELATALDAASRALATPRRSASESGRGAARAAVPAHRVRFVFLASADPAADDAALLAAAGRDAVQVVVAAVAGAPDAAPESAERAPRVTRA